MSFKSLKKSRDSLVQDYVKYRWQKALFIIGGIVLLIVMMGISITMGDRNIAFTDVYEILWAHITGTEYVPNTDAWWDDVVVWDVRLPRVVIAIIAGCGLSIAGAAMQSIMKNPLADPYTTGISSATVFGVTLAMILGITFTSTLDQYGIVLNAFIFGMIPAIFMMFISRFGPTSPATLILSGVAISYFFGALSTLLTTMANEDDMEALFLWQMGSLNYVIWDYVPIMLSVVLTGSLILQFTSKKLNILSLGDESAKSLGLNAEGYRLLCLALLSMMTAAIISFVGILGFIGLVVPHICRMVLGSDNRFVIPASAILGPIVLLGADMISRAIVPSGDLPVGIIMSFVGAPIFLYLVIKQRKAIW